MFKHVNRTEKYTANLNLISLQEWVEHNKRLWYNDQAEVDFIDIEDSVSVVYDGDEISVQELEEALNKMRNRNALG